MDVAHNGNRPHYTVSVCVTDVVVHVSLLVVQLNGITATRGCVVEQLSDFLDNPLAVPLENALSFIRTCERQISELDQTIIEKPPTSLAAHRKAVVGYLTEVRAMPGSTWRSGSSPSFFRRWLTVLACRSPSCLQRLGDLKDLVKRQVDIRSKYVRTSQGRLVSKPLSSLQRPAASAGTAASATSAASADLPDLTVSAQRRQQFEKENDALLKELQSELEETELVEREMVEISHLMSTFAEKVRDVCGPLCV